MPDYVEVGKILEFLDAETNALNSTFGEIDGEAGAYVACFKNVRSYIERFPTADVEPVVHCRDCKYQTKRWYSDKRFRHGGYYFYGCDNMENSDLGQDNNFCARGERKTT